MLDYILEHSGKIALGALIVGGVGCFLWHFLKYMYLFRRMRRCVEAGDSDKLAALLEKYHQEAEEMEYRSALLVSAIFADDPKSVRVLLDGRDGKVIQAQLEEEDIDFLSLAVGGAGPQVLRLLLESGMKPADDSHSLWLMCCGDALVEHAKVLADFGYDKLTPGQVEADGGKTALHVAVYGSAEHPEEAADMLKYLLKKGEDVNAMTPAGNTPLDLACDRSHVRVEEENDLAALLEAAGGKRGASLRVPHPRYTARVFVKGDLPDISQMDLPEGVTVQAHEGTYQDEDKYFADYLAENLEAADAERIRNHSAYLEITVQGAEHELPVKAAGRAYAVAYRLSQQPGVVGVQFARKIAPKFSGMPGNPEAPMPWDLVPFHSFTASDKSVEIVCTDGMVDYGLQEYTLAVPFEAYESKDINPLAAMLMLTHMTMEGTTCLEPGHTMTLEGVFTRVEWGEHPISRKPGFIILMSHAETPERYLIPHYKTPEKD